MGALPRFTTLDIEFQGLLERYLDALEVWADTMFNSPESMNAENVIDLAQAELTDFIIEHRYAVSFEVRCE